MQYLELEVSTPQASVYQIKGKYTAGLYRYIVSTPETRQICNRPEVLGCEYTDMLRTAMVSALKTLPFVPKLLEENPEKAICVLNVLRGGLNFDLRGALHLAYGLNRHPTSFMSSQRYKDKEHWIVKEDSYRKFNFSQDAVVFIGDVVATGSTVDNCLKIFTEHLYLRRSGLKNLVFFTVGCNKVEEVLTKYIPIFYQISPNYQASYVVYLEGDFKLVSPDTKLRIGIPGTDLVRFDCLLAPEFELSQYEEVGYPLERCTIYDAGSRAFDVAEYLEDVCNYWEVFKDLAHQGWTLYEALKERWPEKEYEDYYRFLQQKQQIWHGVDKGWMNHLYDAYRNRWNDTFLSHSQTPQALLELCETRLHQIAHATVQAVSQPISRPSGIGMAWL